MGLPVTVYRWDDAGAPTLNPTPSGIIAILKACLIDGYGAKSALGWTMPFSDAATYKAVFRNSTIDGSGGYFQIESENGTDASNMDITITAAASMTGLGTYVNKSYLRTIRLSFVDTRWVLIGTSRGFYLQTLDSNYTASQNRAGAYSQMFFLGDIHSFYSPDAGEFVSIVGNTTSDDVSGSGAESLSNISSPHHYLNKLYDTDGANAWSIYGIITCGTSTLIGNGSPESRGANLFLFEPIITLINVGSTVDRNGIPCVDSTTRPLTRGKLPGYVLASTNGYYDEPWGITRDINGVNHFGFPYNYGVSCWVNMESWYD